MKKSKLLRNSKDLLSRSFNSAKFKTSLRLAGSRLKLLRNKKEVQVKQMKREIAQLLEFGQDQTARIRKVEHVIREEKMMAAYDLLEIYCELIVARLPIIESQKNCPIDLKEAITSLVFAAARCGDVPELLDVRKQITAKYGKDYTTAAIELRPQCGVGRMLVEKLSAMAPDVPTKTRFLSAIAEEHNVKWEPTSFGEKDSVPPNSRLVGSFGKESEQYAEPHRFEAAQVQARPSNNTMHSSPSRFSQPDDSTSLGNEKLFVAETSGFSSPQSEARPPALRDEWAEEVNSTNSLDKRRWNMDFKDATSAAQAAAESAEHASMAARAAAELSVHGRISRQYSTESHKSDVNTMEDGPKVHHLKSKFSNASIDRLSTSEHTKLQNEQIDGIKSNDLKIATMFKEDGACSLQEYSLASSSKSKASADGKSSDHGIPVIDDHSQKNFSKEYVSDDEIRVDKQTFSYDEAETAKSWPEKAENVKDGKIGKLHSIKSFHSQCSFSDDVNIFSNFKNVAGENPLLGSDKVCINGEAPQSSSHESAAVFFDNYDSDIDDHHGFDMGSSTNDEQELDFHLPSLGQKSPERMSSMNTDSWSPRASSSKIVGSTTSLFFTREELSPDLSENTRQRNDSAPVTFDESDGPISENDEDMNGRHNKVDHSREVRKPNEIGHSETRQLVESPFKHEDNSIFDSKDLSLSSDDEFDSSIGTHWKRNQVNIFGPKESQMESKEIDGESIPESGEMLNFGKLTGGFRHKGYNHLPFIKNRSDASSSSIKKEAETTATIITATTVERTEIGTMLDHKKSSRKLDQHSDSDSDSSEEEEYLRRSYDHKKASATEKDIKTNSNSFFGSINSDLDEDSPKESLSMKSYVQSGISRRTNASPSASSKADSRLKVHHRSEALDSDAGIARKNPTFSNSETPKKTESHRKNSDKLGTYKKPTSMPAKSNIWVHPESEARDCDASPGREPSNFYTPDTRQEFGSWRNSSRVGNSEQPTTENPKSVKSTSTTKQESEASQKSCTIEGPKAQAPVGSGNIISNKDEGAKKASHVHPKLPDYDTLFQSLRMNHS
ncbi:hypothetical protein OROGR_017199 [Orobanche gracilis]